MIKYLKLLTPEQQEALAQAIQPIVAMANPNQVYCYAYSTHTQQSWSCTKPAPAATPDHDQYHLLLVLPDHDPRNLTALAQQLQAIITAPMLFRCKLITADQWPPFYLEGDLYTDVHQKGILLQREALPSKQSLHRSLSILVVGIVHNWEAAHKIAAHYIITATRSTRKHQYMQAVLMLYKACILLTKGLIHAYTGSTPHNIELSRLLNICDAFSPEKTIFFPRTSPEDSILLARFEYIGQNGKPHASNPVSAAMLQTLIERTMALQLLATSLMTKKEPV
jgi:hypothetical protein